MQLLKLNDKQWLVADKEYQNIVSKEWFDISFWQQNDAVIGQSVGRGVTYFFNHANKDYVLREYRRGGLIGKFIEKKYFFKNLETTRAYQELKVLQKLRKLDLPVPEPVAALIETQGKNYQARIIIGLIKDAEDLFHYLKKQALSFEQWQQVGAMIRQFHQQGLYHSDLNIHNIMLNSQGKFWLIDFDKGEFVAPMNGKLNKNLERLLRSLRKEKQKHPEFHWQESDWDDLLLGYAS